MDINLQTKVADLLNEYPQLEKELLELSPVFSKLRNPILRRTVAKVTSLQQAASVAGISPALMVQRLRNAAGLSAGEITDVQNDCEEDAKTSPYWFDKTKIVIKYDACTVLDDGKSPMQEIIKLSLNLKQDEILQLTTPFKPVPIIDLLKSKNFRVWCKSHNNDIINSFITRK